MVMLAFGLIIRRVSIPRNGLIAILSLRSTNSTPYSCADDNHSHNNAEYPEIWPSQTTYPVISSLVRDVLSIQIVRPQEDVRLPRVRFRQWL